MKSRLTTYMLLAAVAAIWGAIAWRLLSAGGGTVAPAEPAAPRAVVREAVADTLVVDYPDPFLKGRCPEPGPDDTPVHARLRPVARPVTRESPACEHLGTVRAGGTTLYIVMLGDEQYEAECGDSVAGFVLYGADGDSLYMVRDGVKYGMRLCE